MLLEPVAQGIVYASLPALAGGAECVKQIGIKADGGGLFGRMVKRDMVKRDRYILLEKQEECPPIHNLP